MSANSTRQRTKRRSFGLPVSPKEKLRWTIAALLNISKNPEKAKELAIITLTTVGVKIENTDTNQIG